MDISNSKRKISSSSDSETNSKQFKGFHASTSTTNHACQSCGSRESRPSSPILVSDLEKSTRQWTQHHLDILRIYPRLRKSHLVDPVDFIQENMTHFLGYKGMKDYNDLKAKYISEQYNITQCMVDLMNMIEIDFNHFKYVTIGSITKMKTDLKRWRRQMLDNNISEELTDICLRTEVYGQSFAEQLEYMVTTMNMNGHVMEGMYQQLFMLYLQIFGLKVYGFSNIANGSMDIKLNNVMAMNTGIKTITSEPDLLIMDNKNLSSIEVTAVVEVKGDNGINSVKPGSSASRSRDKSDQVHISTNLIGRHGGDLLIHSPLSVFEGHGIFGIMVQATKVSLSFFAPESGYLQNVQDGCLDGKQAEIFISEECNILSKSGRQALLTPLLELSFVQKLCKLKGKEAFHSSR